MLLANCYYLSLKKCTGGEIQVSLMRCSIKGCGFFGTSTEAKCPAFRGTFNANKEVGDLALNLYLTSLIIFMMTNRSSSSLQDDKI